MVLFLLVCLMRGGLDVDTRLSSWEIFVVIICSFMSLTWVPHVEWTAVLRSREKFHDIFLGIGRYVLQTQHNCTSPNGRLPDND